MDEQVVEPVQVETVDDDVDTDLAEQDEVLTVDVDTPEKE